MARVCNFRNRPSCHIRSILDIKKLNPRLFNRLIELLGESLSITFQMQVETTVKLLGRQQLPRNI
jgi:hypothetical protein